MDTDKRWYVTAFEVHYWPSIGRILMIHLTGMGSAPLVTEITVNVGTGSTQDTTMVTAHALAQFADPTGDVVRHGASGRMERIDWPSMKEQSVR
jgi:hypothetical protein